MFAAENRVLTELPRRSRDHTEAHEAAGRVERFAPAAVRERPGGGAIRPRGGRCGPPTRSAGKRAADEGLVDVADQFHGPDSRGEYEPQPLPQRLFVAGHDRQQLVCIQVAHPDE